MLFLGVPSKRTPFFPKNHFPVCSDMWHTGHTYTTLTTTEMSHFSHPPNTFFTDVQVAAMLGLNPVTVRKWRTKNKKLGLIKYGPPYEFRGPNVVYPKDRFATWCSQVQVVDGVPRANLPISANIAVPAQRDTVNEVGDVE